MTIEQRTEPCWEAHCDNQCGATLHASTCTDLTLDAEAHEWTFGDNGEWYCRDCSAAMECDRDRHGPWQVWGTQQRCTNCGHIDDIPNIALPDEVPSPP